MPDGHRFHTQDLYLITQRTNMYIAQGRYIFSTPSETILGALIQLCTFNVFTIDDSIKVTLTFDGHIPFTYSYSIEYTQLEALEDAVLSNYKKFDIKLYQEI